MFADVVEEEDDNVDALYDKTTKEPIYVNMSIKQLSNPIPVKDVEAFMHKAKENDNEIVRNEHGVG